MPSVFRGFTIAFSGDFGKTATLPKMQNWLRTAVGTYSSEIDEHVTHLVCSLDNFKKNVPMGQFQRTALALVVSTHVLTQVPPVRQALARSSIKIVTYDWFEDCCLYRTSRRVRKEHLVSNSVCARAAAKTARRKARRAEVKHRSTYRPHPGDRTRVP